MSETLNIVEIQASIARSNDIIMRVDKWRTTEYQAKYEELQNLQSDLEHQIEIEEKYHRRIAQRLDRIAKLKEIISEKVPDDNNFRQNYKS